MASYKVTEESFDLCKKLLSAGVKAVQISKITGFSNCTVNNIKVAVDLDDYRRIVTAQFEKKKAYDDAKANKAKVQVKPKKSYTVTMVINVDVEHDNLVAPLTALVNNMFGSDNVAVEGQHSGS